MGLSLVKNWSKLPKNTVFRYNKFICKYSQNLYALIHSEVIMATPFQKYPLRLEQVLEKIIDRLQTQGLIDPNLDPKKLLEETMENLTKTLGEGNLPNSETLKNPMIIMKLTLSVIATAKDPENKPINKADPKTTPIDKIFQMQTPEQLQELKKDLQLTPQILKFMQVCIGEKIRQNNNNAPDDPDKNKFVGLYSADGTLLDKYEGVFATSGLAGEKIQTAEELLTLVGVAENLKQEIDDAMHSLETAPRPHI